MKEKGISLIMFIISMTIIVGLLFVFGVFYQEYKSAEVEDFEMAVGSKVDSTNSDIEENQKEIKASSTFEDIKEPNKNVKNNTNKHYYKQLNSNARKFYDGFINNIDNMKSGNYKISFGSSFSNVLAKEGGDKEISRDYQSAIEAFSYDNPQVFYINPNKLYVNFKTTTKLYKKEYEVFVNNGDEVSYLIDEFPNRELVDNAIKEIESVRDSLLLKKSNDDYRNVKMVHDYLIENVSYDETVSGDNIYNLYGALVNKKAVCEGYAKTFKYLMDSMDIPCVLVIGNGKNSKGQVEKHSWNYVQLYGSWYAVDVTWDDPIIQGGGRLSSKSKYKYFLKGSIDFNKDHQEEYQFTVDGQIFKYPVLSKEDYK